MRVVVSAVIGIVLMTVSAGCGSDDNKAETSESSTLTYGTTASFEGSDGGAIKVTVSAPTTFRPSAQATAREDRSRDTEPAEVNVYFSVSVQNFSTDAVDLGLLTSNVGDKSGASALAIVDNGIDGNTGGTIAPGTSSTFKDGWSTDVPADQLEYEVTLGKLSGYSDGRETVLFAR